MLRSKVTGNHATRYGGGIDIEGTPGPIPPIDLTLTRTKIVGNRADDDSGAADIDGGGDVTIDRSVVSDNDSGSNGAMYLYADAGNTERISETTIAGNHSDDDGGGVFISNDDEASAELVASTVSGNSTSGAGGGIALDGGAFRVANSTLAANTAALEGGGIYASGSGRVSLNAVTLVRNSAGVAGGGLFFLEPGGFAVQNSLIALNGATGLGDDCASDGDREFTSLGHNLLGANADCLGFDATGDFVNPDPKLGQLKSNGGPTLTVALKKGSPAINKANKASAPKRDERGVKRGKRPDIGAYERVKKKKNHHRHR